MKKLNLSSWQSLPPALLFTGEGSAELSITWPNYAEKEGYRDALTGLPNRGAFDEALESAVKESNRQNAGFGLIILDIDFFKSVNDTYGHKTGDSVLQVFAAIIQSTMRASDIYARIGGEEFCVITTAKEKVFNIGERLRSVVESKNFTVGDNMNINITCSFGCAVFPEHAALPGILYEAADSALYKAKENGRNQGLLFSKHE